MYRRSNRWTRALSHRSQRVYGLFGQIFPFFDETQQIHRHIHRPNIFRTKLVVLGLAGAKITLTKFLIGLKVVTLKSVLIESAIIAGIVGLLPQDVAQ